MTPSTFVSLCATFALVLLWASVAISAFGVAHNGEFLCRALRFYLRCSPRFRTAPVHARRIRFGAVVTARALACLTVSVGALLLAPHLPIAARGALALVMTRTCALPFSSGDARQGAEGWGRWLARLWAPSMVK
jgi:hypothetical protein